MVSLGLMAAVPGFAWADDTIFSPTQPAGSFAGDQKPTVISADTIENSPTMRDHRDEVLAAAEAKLNQLELAGAVSPDEKVQIKGWFKELPFHRIVDVKLSFLSGIPDLIGICLQATPVYYVSVDACAGSILFISSLSVHVSSRVLHWENIKGDVKPNGSTSYWGDEISVGPSVGYRTEAIFGIDTSGGTAQALDAVLSAEWVHWFSRYFGLGLQLDGGVTYAFQEDPSGNVKTLLPNVKLSIGLSF